MRLESMEDKRIAVAVFVCIAVFLIYQELVITPYTKKMEQQRPAVQTQVATQGQPTQTNTQLPPSNVQLQANVQPQAQNLANPATMTATRPTRAELNAAPVIRVENKDFVTEINYLGARLSSYQLKGYKKDLGKADLYEMVSTSETAPLPLAVYSAGVSDDKVLYTLQTTSIPLNGTIFIPEGSKSQLDFVGVLPNGNQILKRFQFGDSGYLFNLTVNLTSPSSDGTVMWLEWSHDDSDLNTRPSWDFHGFTHLVGNKFGRQIGKDTPQGFLDLGSSPWITYADKYFMAGVMNKNDAPSPIRIGREGNTFLERIAGGSQEGLFSIYVGPKEYSTLINTGHQLERNIDLGWFTFLAYPLLLIIKFFYSVFGNYGLAIIAMTLVIKFLFLPLTKKSFVSMAQMQKLQPEMQSIRERFKGDPTRMNQEVMDLYKRNKVNPMSGCLPILIQLPVFLGLYNALQNSLDLRHAPFALWIVDLSSPEKLMVAGIGIPVMVIIMGISMFVQQWMTPSAMDPTQKKIMMFMPVIFTFMFINFPAGLVLYWLTNNIISIVQQYYIKNNEMAFATRGSVIASFVIFGFAYLLTLI